MTSKSVSARRALLACRCPTKCQRAAVRPTAGIFASASWTRFSPKSIAPRSMRLFIRLAGCVLLIATRLTSSGLRPQFLAAAAICALTLPKRAASPSARWTSVIPWSCSSGSRKTTEGVVYHLESFCYRIAARVGAMVADRRDVMKSLFAKKLLGAAALVLLLVLSFSPASGQGRGRGHGRGGFNGFDRKCGKFVNCHDARDGRWDGRGPRRNTTWTSRYYRRSRRNHDRRWDSNHRDWRRYRNNRFRH